MLVGHTRACGTERESFHLNFTFDSGGSFGWEILIFSDNLFPVMLRKSSEQKALDLTLIKTSDAHKKFAFSTPVKVLENWEDDAEIKQIVN